MGRRRRRGREKESREEEGEEGEREKDVPDWPAWSKPDSIFLVSNAFFLEQKGFEICFSLDARELLFESYYRRKRIDYTNEMNDWNISSDVWG